MGMTGLQREGYASLRLIFGTKQGRLNYLANQVSICLAVTQDMQKPDNHLLSGKLLGNKE